MIKWYISKIKLSIFMLFVSSISYSSCITFGLLKEIALRHEENISFFVVMSVITYIVCVVTLIIGLHTLSIIEEKIISKGNNEVK